MDKFNLLEHRSYSENYKLISEHLKKNEFRILFEIKKCINRNAEKRRYTLRCFKQNWKNNNIFEALDYKPSRRLFQAFLISMNQWNINETFTNLKCYDLCVDALKFPRKVISDEQYKQNFLEVIPDFPWENRINKYYECSSTGNKKVIEKLKKKCIKRIKKSLEMTRFCEALDKEDEWVSEERKNAWKYNRKVIDKLLLLMNKINRKQTEL